MPGAKGNRYAEIIERIFLDRYKKGAVALEFEREDIERVATQLGIRLPKNLGDLLYSFRFRTELPAAIVQTAPRGREWTIKLAGRSRYKFRLSKINRIVPSEDAYRIKIPDATPEIIATYAKTDEQALLAKVRYNRLVDIFLRVTAYSLQNHLRTTVPDLGQIEVDELYVGVRNTGQQFIIPVQAKGGNDRLATAQAEQDYAFCRHAYPSLTPRLVAVQFMDDGAIAMFELAFQDDDLTKIDEKQYRLLKADAISETDLQTMAGSSD